MVLPLAKVLAQMTFDSSPEKMSESPFWQAVVNAVVS